MEWEKAARELKAANERRQALEKYVMLHPNQAGDEYCELLELGTTSHPVPLRGIGDCGKIAVPQSDPSRPSASPSFRISSVRAERM